MKRTLRLLTVAIAAMITFSSSLSGQENEAEKKVEKRIKIVTVDEQGHRVIKDTTITGEGAEYTIKVTDDFEWKSEDEVHVNAFKVKDGSIVMFSHKGDSAFTISEESAYVADRKHGKVMIMTSDDGSTFSVTRGDKDFRWTAVEIDEEELDEGEVHIIIKSKGEVEDLKIKGDAVITIKDGKASVVRENTAKEEKAATDKKKK